MAKEIQHPTLGEKTYQELKNLILSGRIKPGERLRYQSLVKLLGVSQTPIKEAFTRLENEGYVVSLTRKGTFVRDHSARDIREIFQIREMLEALAARLVCASGEGAALLRLKNTNARFKNACERRDVRACTKEDYAFHETLIEASENHHLIEIMRRTNLHLLSIAQSSPNFFEIADNYHRTHTRIIEAIARRDEAEAERLMREHIAYGREQVLPFVEQDAKLAASG